MTSRDKNDIVIIDDQQRCTDFLHVGERRRLGFVQRAGKADQQLREF